MSRELGPNDENRELTEVSCEDEGRALVCMFCGEGFGYVGKSPDEETIKTAVSHEKDCTRNPYKAEIARLHDVVMQIHNFTVRRGLVNQDMQRIHLLCDQALKHEV